MGHLKFFYYVSKGGHSDLKVSQEAGLKGMSWLSGLVTVNRQMIFNFLFPTENKTALEPSQGDSS